MATKKKPPVGELTVHSVDGSAYALPIQAPGSAIRFAVGVDGAHGMVWRLWSSTRDTDLYLAIRDGRNGGDAKYSFHASGDWRLQYEYSRAQALGVHRVLEKWDRPPLGANGAIDVARILTPSDDIVQTGRPEPDAGKILWIEPGPPRTLNALKILLIPSLTTFAPPPDMHPIAAMMLVDGSTVIVLRAVVPMTPVEDDLFQKVRDAQGKQLPPGATEPYVYVPRADPEYRCEVYMRAEGTDDLIIVDLLM